MSAKWRSGIYYRNEEGSRRHQGQGRAVDQGGPEFDQIGAAYKKVQRASNVATAKGFGVKDPEKIIDTYETLIEKKWRGLSKDIGRDIDKFTEVLNANLLKDRPRQALIAYAEKNARPGMSGWLKWEDGMSKGMRASILGAAFTRPRFRRRRGRGRVRLRLLATGQRSSEPRRCLGAFKAIDDETRAPSSEVVPAAHSQRQKAPPGGEEQRLQGGLGIAVYVPNWCRH